MLEVQVNQEKPVKVTFQGTQLAVNNEVVNWDLVSLGGGHFHIIKNNTSFKAELVNYNAEEKTFKLRINQSVYTVKLKDRFDLLLHEMGMDTMVSQKANDLKAPMPGLILKILVAENQEVKKGDSLVLLEAMKMENVLKAAGDGVVKKIIATEKTTVEKGQLLIQMV